MLSCNGMVYNIRYSSNCKGFNNYRRSMAFSWWNILHHRCCFIRYWFKEKIFSFCVSYFLRFRQYLPSYMHSVLCTDMSKQEILIKCPICGTILPQETEFCVYCGTLFDHKTITKINSECTEDKENVIK